VTPPSPVPRARLAVTLGDPRGIGPEVMSRAARRFVDEDPDIELVLLGPDGADPDVGEYRSMGRWDGTERSAGEVSLAALETGVELAMEGAVAGVVTGPVHKPALQAAGSCHPGQTELLQALAGAGSSGMLMCAERTRLGAPLRVLLATRHIPLAQVAARVTARVLVEQTRLLIAGLRTDWAVAEPRVALCALNPHASDGGLFGDEEVRVYAPALEALADEGGAVAGPLPADTVFVRALRGEFDAVVAPYHDVAMAAFKTVSFGTGVNVTLGLPFVRTSPDHGTAFDIAGRGVADASSALEALRLASRVAANRAAAAPRDGEKADRPAELSATP
jgi:4-hydroxythreonine-4-phosphate dehydrogenase